MMGRLFPLLLLVGSIATSASAADVAVLLSAKVDAYEEALLGFEEALDHEIVAHCDMKGDLARGRTFLKKIEQQEVKPDLILAVGIWALQVVAEQGTSVPVVYTMVLNPPSVVGTEARNITGASMNVSVEQTFEVLKKLGISRVGTVYTSEQTGYLVNHARQVASDAGLELFTKEVRTAGDAIKSLDELNAEGIEALWIVPDKTILANKVLKEMVLFSFQENVPLLGLSDRHTKMGAVVSISFASTRDIGRQAGELAGRLLAGEPVAQLPYTTARSKLTVNLKAAQKLGIPIPSSMLEEATVLK